MKTLLKKALAVITKAFHFVKSKVNLNILILGICYGIVWGLFGWITTLFILVSGLLILLIWFQIDAIKLVGLISETIRLDKELVDVFAKLNKKESIIIPEPDLKNDVTVPKVYQDIPEWLDKKELKTALMYYDEGNKLAAVKHIQSIAKEKSDIENTLKWSKDYLDNIYKDK